MGFKRFATTIGYTEAHFQDMCILWPRAKALPKCDRYSIDEHVSMCLSSVYCIAWLLSLLFYHNHNNTQMRVYLCLHAYAFRYAFYTVLYTRIMSRKTDEIWEIWAILGELILPYPVTEIDDDFMGFSETTANSRRGFIMMSRVRAAGIDIGIV